MCRILRWLVLFAPLLLVAADEKEDPKKEEPKKEEPEVKLDDKLQQELLRMREDDQDIRKKLLADPKNPDRMLIQKMWDQDRKHTARLKEIVAKHGWPTAKLVGGDGADAAFAILQHADKDRAFQNKCLKLMDAAAKKGELPMQYVAAMTDYLRVLDKKKQLYGTQFTIGKDGQPAPWPIEDEKNVDERREKVGLPKLADHLKMLKERQKKP